MSETLPPALTPEQWKKFAFQTPGETPLVVEYDAVLRMIRVAGGSGHGVPGFVWPRELYAIMALCNHGMVDLTRNTTQPYGFTREDVALIQGAVERAFHMIPKIAPVGLSPDDASLHEALTTHYSEEMHQWISLANRITALLPPE